MSVAEVSSLLDNPNLEVRRAALGEVVRLIEKEQQKVDGEDFRKLCQRLTSIRDNDLSLKEASSKLLNHLLLIVVRVQPLGKDATWYFRVPVNQPVAFLKLKIEDSKSIGVEEQVLIFHGKSLDDEVTMRDYGVAPSDILTLVVSEGAPLELPKWLPFRTAYKAFLGVESPYELLKHIGYKYNNNLQLRSIQNGAPYNWVDQTHYDRVGEICTLVVEEYLTEVFGFIRTRIPADAEEGDPTGYIFCSRGALTCDNLMVFFPMHGTVRAGTWIRGVCVNDDLHKGTMFPFIKEALVQGFGVILLNPNQTKDPVTQHTIIINKSPVDHTLHCYDNIIKHSVARRIVCIGHSTGGDCLQYLLTSRPEIIPKIGCLVYLDSSHTVVDSPAQITQLVGHCGKGWAANQSPVGTQLAAFTQKWGCPATSSGNAKNNFTPHLSKQQIWVHINHHFPNQARNAPLESSLTKGEEAWVRRQG